MFHSLLLFEMCIRDRDEETAVLVIIDDMNLIARGTEPRIVLPVSYTHLMF